MRSPQVLQIPAGIDVAYIGPRIEEGPLPAIFYFALSAYESLYLDPYNQPALSLSSLPIRIFSFDLPAHGPNLKAVEAVHAWAIAFQRGEDPLAPFLNKVFITLETLLDKQYLVPEKIGFMGLSRGCLISSLIASQFAHVHALLHFAPLTKLTATREFADLPENSTAQSYNLTHHLSDLYDKSTRIYIGNRDKRVGTDLTMQWTLDLAETAFQNNLRSPPIELVVSPSIGHLGHGTSKEVFEAGADWLGQKLGIIQ